MQKRSRGRPAEDKSDIKMRLLEVATSVLLEGGFARFSIAAVAKSGGVAKKTIYNFVANREELVGEIVKSWTSRFLEARYEISATDVRSSSSDLEALLFNIYRTALSPEAIALFRLITSDPEARECLAKSYNDNGIDKAASAVSTLLKNQISKIRDPEFVARAMLAWLIGESLRKASLGLETPFEISDEEVKRKISCCIAMYKPLLCANAS